LANREVVFIDGMRTAFGRMGGTIKDIPAAKLGSIAVRGLLEKTKISEKAHVDSVFLGTAMGCATTGNPARWVALDSGLPRETSASYVEMQCGSAIDSINHAAWRILANQADIMIAGGMESYSQAFVKFTMTNPPLYFYLSFSSSLSTWAFNPVRLRSCTCQPFTNTVGVDRTPARAPTLRSRVIFARKAWSLMSLLNFSMSSSRVAAISCIFSLLIEL